MNKKGIRLLVDIGMVVLLPLLMAYSLIGEKFHEMIGTVMTILFVTHLLQNRKWVTALPKGRYNARRAFQTILDLTLLVFMILQIGFVFSDFGESRILFILDYLAVMVLLAVIGLLITAGLSNKGKRKR